MISVPFFGNRTIMTNGRLCISGDGWRCNIDCFTGFRNR